MICTYDSKLSLFYCQTKTGVCKICSHILETQVFILTDANVAWSLCLSFGWLCVRNQHYKLRIGLGRLWHVVTLLIQHQENMAVYRRGSIFYGCSGWDKFDQMKLPHGFEVQLMLISHGLYVLVIVYIYIYHWGHPLLAIDCRDCFCFSHGAKAGVRFQ